MRELKVTYGIPPKSNNALARIPSKCSRIPSKWSILWSIISKVNVKKSIKKYFVPNKIQHTTCIKYPYYQLTKILLDPLILILFSAKVHGHYDKDTKYIKHMKWVRHFCRRYRWRNVNKGRCFAKWRKSERLLSS